MVDTLLKKWHQIFGTTSPEVIVRAPGRVNIIGEHTDYNEGWVLPGAMSRSVYVLVSRNNENIHHWVANDLDQEFQYRPEEDGLQMPLWVKYVEGTIRLYADKIGALKILIGGNLPVGAGVSSSSSLVCGLLFAFQKLSGRNESKEELGLIGSRVEREIIGLQGGIMDQFAILLSKSDHVMLLDCRHRKYQFIPVALPGCRWLLINTKVKHQLIDSDYNYRAEECKRAVSIIQKRFFEVMSLRDVNLEMLDEIEMPEVLQMRSVFVIEENHRVHAMVSALENHDVVAAGQLLMASHAGLRDQYEVSCKELDFLADFANDTEGVYGGRMMGGGFGGCVICLLPEIMMDSFSSSISNAYQMQFGFAPEIIDFELSSGVEEIKVG